MTTYFFGYISSMERCTHSMLDDPAPALTFADACINPLVDYVLEYNVNDTVVWAHCVQGTYKGEVDLITMPREIL